MKAAIISFGSNLGDLGANLIHARERLEAYGYIINKCSGVYLTPAMGFESTNNFYNAVVEVLTLKDAESVLHDLLEIEHGLGRARHSKSYTDRIIDLDLISYAGLTRTTSLLTLPHPRYQDRLFVLIPLRDICPDWYDNNLKTSLDEMILVLKNQVLPERIELDICSKTR